MMQYKVQNQYKSSINIYIIHRTIYIKGKNATDTYLVVTTCEQNMYF